VNKASQKSSLFEFPKMNNKLIDAIVDAVIMVSEHKFGITIFKKSSNKPLITINTDFTIFTHDINYKELETCVNLLVNSKIGEICNIEKIELFKNIDNIDIIRILLYKVDKDFQFIDSCNSIEIIQSGGRFK
jgi:hypothetical protein